MKILVTVSSWAVAFGMGLIIGACSRSADPPDNSAAAKSNLAGSSAARATSAGFGFSLTTKAAMDGLFEKVGDAPSTRYIWKNIDAPPQKDKNRTASITDGIHGEVWALGLRELDAHRAVLVTGLTQLDDSGRPDHCHACSGRASVFYFERRENKEWELDSVELEVAQFGSHGGSGTFSFVDLGPGRPGFLFDSGGTWQGYTVSSLQIFEIGKNNKTIPRTKSFIKLVADHACDESEMSEDCFSVQGQWRFLPGPDAATHDLFIEFSGYVTEPGQGRRQVQDQARYRIQGGVFVLVDGNNPVPDV